MEKLKINEIILVEGRDDVTALKIDVSEAFSTPMLSTFVASFLLIKACLILGIRLSITLLIFFQQNLDL